MATILHQHLFSWDEIDAQSDAGRLQLALQTLPDEKIVRALEEQRANGRDTYPVRATWNALIAGIVYQHETVESLLRELRRNGELRQVCGFNPILGAAAVPTPWAMSRFVSNVVALEHLVEEIFRKLVDDVASLLPDLGRHLAFDGKAVPSFSTGRKNKETGQTSDPDADWGVKSYKGIGKDGRPWEKVKTWFGYQLHLIVDSTYEIPVAFEVMPASTSEATRLLPMVQGFKQEHPEILGRCTDFTADKGLDSGIINKALWDEYKIRPIIDSRTLWRQEKLEQGYDPKVPITRSLDPNSVDNIVYTEKGAVLCVSPVSNKMTKMQYMGFEADRNTLKYRCPAAAFGFECPGRAKCERNALGRPTSFGRIVRVNLDIDRRVFTPVPRHTPKFDRIYATRSAVERVNSRVADGLRFDRHTIRGLEKMKTRMALGLAVMLAMAVGFIKQGKPELVRSLVGNTRAVRIAA